MEQEISTKSGESGIDKTSLPKTLQDAADIINKSQKILIALPDELIGALINSDQGY